MPYMMSVQAQEKAAAGAAEIVQNLDLIITKMLMTFHGRTRKKPSKIIVFRGITFDTNIRASLSYLNIPLSRIYTVNCRYYVGIWRLVLFM